MYIRSSMFERFRRKPDPQLIDCKIGPSSVKVAKWSLDFIHHNDWNLKSAVRQGLKPITFEELLEQLDPNDLGNIVLFDTPPDNSLPGNHWRIVSVNLSQRTASLSFCETFGNYDFLGISSLEIPIDIPMFTGISYQRYELNGNPVTLAVARIAQETVDKVKHTEDRILFVNSSGKLETKGSRTLKTSVTV